MKPMRSFPFIQSGQAVTLLRVAVSLFMIAHGIARVYLGTVGNFGGFLNSKGFLIGRALCLGHHHF